MKNCSVVRRIGNSKAFWKKVTTSTGLERILALSSKACIFNSGGGGDGVYGIGKYHQR